MNTVKTYSILEARLLAVLLIVGVLAITVLANTYMYEVRSKGKGYTKMKPYMIYDNTYARSCILGRSTWTRRKR